MLSNCHPSQSGIPNNAGQLPGTKKKLLVFDALLFILTLHTPICIMLELKYVSNITFCPLTHLDLKSL